MKFAIVECGGKQYRAVEGVYMDVDRLANEAGSEFVFERVLLVSEGDAVTVGSPVVSGITVSATVMDHVKGPKVISFKYRPKKRIRVKGGHRHQYTRLMVDFIGKLGDKPAKPAKQEKPKAEKAPKAEKVAKPKKEAAPKAESKKAPAKKSAPKKSSSK